MKKEDTHAYTSARVVLHLSFKRYLILVLHKIRIIDKITLIVIFFQEWIRLVQDFQYLFISRVTMIF